MITPEQAEIIQAAIEDSLIDVHTSIPGKVQSYDAAKQTADIKILIKRALQTDDGTYTVEELPILPNVPVKFQRGGGFMSTMPVAAGDTGLLVFSEVSMDQWRSLGDTASPVEVGRHGLSNGVFFPGLAANSRAITDDISSDAVFGKEAGAQMRVKTSGTIEVVTGGGPTASDFVAMAAKVDNFITLFDTVMRTSWVPVAQDGGAALKTAYTATFTTPPISTASTNLKAD